MGRQLSFPETETGDPEILNSPRLSSARPFELSRGFAPPNSDLVRTGILRRPGTVFPSRPAGRRGVFPGRGGFPGISTPLFLLAHALE